MVAALCAAGSVALVAFAWRIVFRRTGRPFWVAMSAATACLGLIALLARGPGPWAWRLTPAGLGLAVASAGVLYGMFAGGNRLAARLAPAVATSGQAVYGMTAGVAAPALTALLLLVIGPGEELYWRGFVQWEAGRVLPAWAAVLAAALIYAAVHLSARSPALVVAALVCGLFWGTLYAISGSLAMVIVSHALWDCLALIWLPLRPARAATHSGRTSAVPTGATPQRPASGTWGG